MRRRVPTTPPPLDDSDDARLPLRWLAIIGVSGAAAWAVWSTSGPDTGIVTFFFTIGLLHRVVSRR